MSDLRQEIEARKSRIAELRRQREAHAVPTPSPPPAAPLTLVVPAVAHIDIAEPYLYTKQTQSEPLAGAVLAPPADAPTPPRAAANAPDGAAPESADREAGRAPDPAPATFRVAAPDHVAPPLLTFIDDSWRAVARARVRDFRETPRRGPAEPSDRPHVALVATRPGAHLLAFSPFHALVAARDAANPRRVVVLPLEGPGAATPEFTLRSPSPVRGDLVFSPVVAQRVFGAGQNGQVFMWDLKSALRTGGRYDLLPAMRSPIESSAVVAVAALGTASLVSVTAAGVVHVWAADRLSRPLHTYVLEDGLRGVMAGLRLAAVVPTCLAVFSPPGYGFGLGFGWKVAVVGTLSGHLLRLPVTATGGVYNAVDGAWRHAAGVAALALGDEVVRDGVEYIRLVSAGLDWQIRGWLVPLDEQRAPVLEHEFPIDYAVAAVAVHPDRPAVVAAGGETMVQIYRLGQARPLVSVSTEHAVRRLAFRGSTLAVATTDAVLLYEFDEAES